MSCPCFAIAEILREAENRLRYVSSFASAASPAAELLTLQPLSLTVYTAFDEFQRFSVVYY